MVADSQPNQIPLRRLKKRREFLRVGAEPLKIVTTTFILLAAPAAGNDCGVGFTVTKKLGNAVTRNRIRRRLREASRQLTQDAPVGFDCVLIARNKALDCEYAEIMRDMRYAFAKVAASQKRPA